VAAPRRRELGHDVQAVCGELAHASEVRSFAESLSEPVELASAGRALVADRGDELIVGAEAASLVDLAQATVRSRTRTTSLSKARFASATRER
jgi:hypothetical protein